MDSFSTADETADTTEGGMSLEWVILQITVH